MKEKTRYRTGMYDHAGFYQKDNFRVLIISLYKFILNHMGTVNKLKE